MPIQPQVLCSTGAFVRWDQTRDDYYRMILDYGPILDVDGLEVLFYRSWYGRTDQIAAELSASGLRFPAVHADKGIGPLFASGDAGERAEALQRLVTNCRFARALGASLVVFHLWGFPESEQAIAHALDALPHCLDVAAAHEIDLAVETIPTPIGDPLTIIHQAIQRDPRCLVALDTEFLAFHDQLESALVAPWLWDERRVRHVHVKDYAGQLTGPDNVRRYLHPGDGKIDFAWVFSALQRQRFDGSVSLEAPAIQPDGAIDVARLQHSLGSLRLWITDARRGPA